jgi:hypothetical protein
VFFFYGVSIKETSSLDYSHLETICVQLYVRTFSERWLRTSENDVSNLKGEYVGRLRDARHCCC